MTTIDTRHRVCYEFTILLIESLRDAFREGDVPELDTNNVKGYQALKGGQKKSRNWRFFGRYS